MEKQMEKLPDGITFDGEIYWARCPQCDAKQGDIMTNLKLVSVKCCQCGYTPMPSKLKIPVIYPYSAKKSKWQEINYSIASIKKNFMEPHKIFIMGEDNPNIPGTQYLEHYDDPNLTTEQNNGGKLEKCAVTFNKFVWMNDDFYILKPTDANQIMNTPPLTTWLTINQGVKAGGKNYCGKLLIF